jgi:hypothetical protein
MCIFFRLSKNDQKLKLVTTIISRMVKLRRRRNPLVFNTHKTNTTKRIRTSKQNRSTNQKQPRALKAAKTPSDQNRQRTLKRAIPKLPECEISVEDLDQRYIKMLKEELLKEFVNTSFSKFIDRHQACRPKTTPKLKPKLKPTP